MKPSEGNSVHSRRPSEGNRYPDEGPLVAVGQDADMNHVGYK
jgi:hypothetical protein